jgi:hypothetical protein
MITSNVIKKNEKHFKVLGAKMIAREAGKGDGKANAAGGAVGVGEGRQQGN